MPTDGHRPPHRPTAQRAARTPLPGPSGCALPGIALLLGLVVMPAARAQAQPLPRTVPPDQPRYPAAVHGQPIPLDGVRPRDLTGVLRSTRAPVSVHVGANVPVGTARAVLALAEHTLDRLEFDLSFPPPAPDGDRGGDPGLDLYLGATGPAVDTVVDALEHLALWDRASAFVRIRAEADPRKLARAVAEGVTRAAALGVNAAVPPAYLLGLGAAVADQITGEGPDPTAVRAFQRHAARALLVDHGEASSRGAGVAIAYLARRHQDPAFAIAQGLLWASVSRTPGSWPRLWSEPDVLDVAQRVFRDDPGGLPGALLALAVERTLLGTPGDPYQLAGTSDPSLAAAPLRETSYAGLPVYVAPAAPLEPTGHAAVVVDLGNAPLNASLGVWLHASPWRRWMASVVRIDTAGRVAGRWDSELITDGHWSHQLDLLDGFARVIVVVLDLGAEDFDPDLPQSANGFFALHVAPVR